VYIAIISFIIWGFFNFFMIQFRGTISPINVILFLYIFAFSFMMIYRLFSKETLVLVFKEKMVNIIAGMSQSIVYILYFYIPFLYPSDSIVIAIFYNLFGLILVLLDAMVFKTKNDNVEYFILLLVVLLSMFLILKTQFLLGKSIETISYTSLYGFIPAVFAASVGILYKYASGYKSHSLRNLVHSNFQLLFYRSFGGLCISVIIYLIFILSGQISMDISVLEVKLGVLYALFPFLISHLFYSISIYKKASIIVLSVFMNLSPIITVASMYYFSDIQYTFDNSIFIGIAAILILSSLLSIYHTKKHHFL